MERKGPSTRAKAEAEAEPEAQCVEPVGSTGNLPKKGFRAVGFEQREAWLQEYQGSTQGQGTGDLGTRTEV